MFKFNVSQELREQIVNIIDDLVNEIAPGYLPPNLFFPKNYGIAIYEEIYKSLSSEFGWRRLEKYDYRNEIFEALRNVPSEEFFKVAEHLLKVVYRIVHIQITRSDNIVSHPSAGNKLWSRKESVRDRHISRFKRDVDKLNYRLAQSNAKYRYEWSGESVQMVRQDTGFDVPKEDSRIQKKDDDQTPEHHQEQSRGEFWNRRIYILTFVGVIVVVLDFAFGNAILIRPLQRLWNYFQTIL